jgi:hypothetical protein
MKTPGDLDAPRPGAYDIQGRAHGEVPEWIQNPRSRPQLPQGSSQVLVSDAEVIPHSQHMDSEAQQIVAATVVIERRIGLERRRHGTNRPAAAASARRRYPTEDDAAMKRAAASDRAKAPVPEESQIEQWPAHHKSGFNSASNHARGRRLSKGSLLEDDEDEYVAQDRFVQGVQSTRMPGDGAKGIYVDHPHVISVLEVFPDANVNRIMGLLRQESLATTFITLAEESAAEPSDIFAFPTELQHATTYAQATDEDRAIIMSYLMDMFPRIGAENIESVLMQHSTHNGVAVLSEVGSQPPLSRKKAPPATAGRQLLIDDDEEDYEFRHPPISWMQQQMDKKRPATSNYKGAAGGQVVFAQKSTHQCLNQNDPLRQQDLFAASINQAPTRDYASTGQGSSEEFDNLKPKSARENSFYDLNGFLSTARNT